MVIFEIKSVVDGSYAFQKISYGGISFVLIHKKLLKQSRILEKGP